MRKTCRRDCSGPEEVSRRFNGDPATPDRTRGDRHGPMSFAPFAGDPATPANDRCPRTMPACCRWVWAGIKPRKGRFRWDVLDGALAAATTRGQTLQMRLQPFGGAVMAAAPDEAGGRRIGPADPWRRRCKMNAWPRRWMGAGAAIAVMTVGVARTSAAAAQYVKPQPDGAGDGSSWNNARGDIQAAINAAGDGDIIYLSAGTWSNAAALVVDGKQNITLSGGWAAESGGTPGAAGSSPTVITRGAGDNRLVTASGATVVWEHMTFAGGRILNENPGRGGGFHLTGCNFTFRHCTLKENSVLWNSSAWQGNGYGGAVYAEGGTLAIRDSIVSGNYVSTFHTAFGGALYLSNVALTLSNCWWQNNYAQEKNSSLRGGAVWLSGGSAAIVDCTFTNNHLHKRYCYNATPQGGALYASGVAPLVLEDCVFAANHIRGYSQGDFPSADRFRQGGPLYLQGGTAQAVRCVFRDNGETDNPAGEIWVAGGNAAFTGCQIRGSLSQGIHVDGGTVSVSNCVVAANAGQGVYVAAGAGVALRNVTLAHNGDWGLEDKGAAFVKNTIAWGNAAGGISGADAVAYSISQEVWAGSGNKMCDPRFVNATAHDYHVRSLAGSWHNETQGFVADDEHSMAIDSGDPADDVGLEPEPNGGRINMGAYGGTPYASKSCDSTDVPASVTNLGAMWVRRQSARLRGAVQDAGTHSGLCEVRFSCWPDGSPTTTDILIGYKGPGDGVLTATISGLQGGTLYHYVVVGANGAGTSSSATNDFTTITAQPSGWYVALDGDGTTGTDWATALTNLQDAVNECDVPGDAVYIKQGSYSNAAAVTLAGRPRVTLRGGYAGAGAPGGAGADTVLTRPDAVNTRLACINASTVAIERVTLSGGRILNQDSGQGGGLYVTANSDVTIADCTLSNNSVFFDAGSFRGNGYGGAVYAEGGRLAIRDSIASGNHVSTRRTAFGGALYLRDVALTLSNCWWQGNYAQDDDQNTQGGAVWLSGGSATIMDCTFTNNHLHKRYCYNATPQGGALYASGVAPLVLEDCVFAANHIRGYSQGILSSADRFRQGGPLYLQGGTAQAVRCVFRDNGETDNPAGEIWVAGGSLAATNLLVAGSASNGVEIAGGTVSLVNATLAGNAGWAAQRTGGTLTVHNSIAWGNAAGGLGAATAVTYSDVQGGIPAGTGNISADPLFIAATAGNYRLQRLSPAVDAGLNEAWQLTATDLDRQPRRQGRVDMGAYERSAYRQMIIFVR